MRTLLLLLMMVTLTSVGCGENFSGLQVELEQSQNSSSSEEDSTDTVDIEEPADEEPVVEDTPPEAEQDICQSQEIRDSLPNEVNSPSLASDLNSLSGVSRDTRVVQEFLLGKGPRFNNGISQVRIQSNSTTIVLCVSNDYFFLRRGEESIRFPLGLTVLKDAIARLDWTLPTTKLVDIIYQQSQTKLSPSTMTPGPQMGSTATIIQHSERINQRLSGSPGLIGGHKKDIVVSRRLLEQSNRIAIYGWHQLNGNPIQPLTIVHHKDYADYSQGVRFIYKKIWVNGTQMSLAQALSQTQLASMLSSEGVMPSTLINQYYSLP